MQININDNKNSSTDSHKSLPGFVSFRDEQILCSGGRGREQNGYKPIFFSCLFSRKTGTCLGHTAQMVFEAASKNVSPPHYPGCRTSHASAPARRAILISHKVFIKLFCKSQFQHKSVNSFSILVITKDK